MSLRPHGRRFKRPPHRHYQFVLQGVSHEKRRPYREVHQRPLEQLGTTHTEPVKRGKEKAFLPLATAHPRAHLTQPQ